MVLQVNYLLHASVSARAHAEVQQDRLLASKVVERNAVARGGRKTEGGRRVAFAEDASGFFATTCTAGGKERNHTQQGKKPPSH